MANYIDMMKRWRDWRLDEATLENETNLPFKVLGINNNDIIIEGKKIKLTLSFKGDDLKNAIQGKGNRKGRVVLATAKIK